MQDPVLIVQCQCGKDIKVRSSSGGKKVRCPQCQTIVEIPMSDPATDDGSDQMDLSPSAPAKIDTSAVANDSYVESNPYVSTASVSSSKSALRSYPTLDLIRKIYRLLAYFVIGFSFLIAVVVVLFAMMSGGDGVVVFRAVVSALMSILSGVGIGVSMLAFSEMIKVVLDIQDNTFRTANRGD